jgi:hypothetical protein
MDKLVYSTTPTVTLATNKFINVPIILQFDNDPIISIIKLENLGYTTEIPIYHPDGTYLAKVRGTRIYLTEAGKKAGLIMRYPELMTICQMGDRTLFEIHNQPGDSFKMQAELNTPNGCFIKTSDLPVPHVIMKSGEPLKIGGVIMRNNTIIGSRIGILIKSNGSLSIGVS